MSADPVHVKTIFLGAAEKSLAERAAYLDAACGEDAELRRRVEQLLRAHDQGDSLLQQPAVATVDLPTPSAETGGTHLGPYKLLQQIGEGGMGTVWLAEQQEPVKRLVALKLIKAGLDSAQVLARFEQERQALALMDHPHIARVLDAGTTASGRPYFVMELVKGVPITRYCDEQQLTPRQRLELMVPVCQAIQHAHHKGIIHRDIKPSNVLVATYDGKPVVKVIDFGVAKATGQKLTERTLFTGFGGVVGTLEYMSPEQAEFNALDIDTRADIYALGVLLYELLTGTTPLPRQRLKQAALAEALRLIREEEPPRPSTRLSESREALPTTAARRKTEPGKLAKLMRGDLDWVVMKALEKDRNRRYETANGFALDIQRYLHDEPVLAGPPSATYRLRKFVRRHRGPVVAAALVLVALLAGVIGTTWGLVAAEQARDDEVQQRLRAEDNQHKAEMAATAEAAQRARAEKAAKDEALAKEQAQKRLAQIEKGIEILGSLFHDLDPDAVAEEGRPLQAVLGERLDAAMKTLDGEAIGDPLAVARLQSILGRSQLGLGYTDKAIVLFTKARQTYAALRGLNDPNTLTSMSNLGLAYLRAGKLDLAVPLCVEALERMKTQLGADHLDTLVSMNNLAMAYRAAGKLDLAVPLFVETLEKRKAQVGADHPDTLAIMNNLAMAYQSAGKLDLAVPLLLGTLEKRKAKLGADHPDTVRSMSSLAAAYREAGKLELAVALYLEALQKRKARLGADHPATLIAMNDLAVAYRAAGKLDLALPLYVEALETQKAKLGADHPDTLVSMHNLAGAYQAAGKLELAVPLYLEVLQKRKMQLGADHPDTLRTMNNLAGAYQAAGKLDLGLPLSLDTLEKCKAKLGADHPVTLSSMHNLAAAYQAAGKLDQAVPLYLEVLQKRKTQLGADHPATLTTMNGLALAYRAAGRLELAVPLYLEVLQKRKTKLGADHPDTLRTMNNLAGAYQAAGKFELAVPLYLEALQKLKAQLGADHPATLTTMNNLAVTYRAAGKLDLALPLYVEGLEKQKAKLGADHPDTLTGMNNLASAYVQAGNYAEAEPLLLGWLDKRRPKLAADDLAVALNLKRLGECRLMLKNYAAAEQPLRESLDIYVKKQPKAVSRYDTANLLGAALAGQQKLAEAEPLLVGSAKVLLANAAKLSVANQKVAAAAVERVIAFYTSQGNADETARWRKLHDQTFPPATQEDKQK
jgi:serine/threonine protein kinase